MLCNSTKNFQILKVCHYCYLLFVFISLNSNVVIFNMSIGDFYEMFKVATRRIKWFHVGFLMFISIWKIHHHTKIFVVFRNEELFFFVLLCAPSTKYAYKIWACFNSVFVHRGFKIQIFHSRNSICLFSNPQYAIIQIVIPYI